MRSAQSCGAGIGFDSLLFFFLLLVVILCSCSTIRFEGDSLLFFFLLLIVLMSDWIND